MNHASIELTEAMAGWSPYTVGALGEPCLRSEGFRDNACKAERGSTRRFGVYACFGGAGDVDSEEDADVVGCPACLVLMRAATDPVRWDALLTLGLVAELAAEAA